MLESDTVFILDLAFFQPNSSVYIHVYIHVYTCICMSMCKEDFD